MNRRIVWLLAGVLVVGALVAVIRSRLGPREPVYGGRPLSAWLERTPGVWPEQYWYRHVQDELLDRLNGEDTWGLVTNESPWTLPTQWEARQAIQAIGPAALPTLLSLLESKETRWDRVRQKLSPVLPRRWQEMVFPRWAMQRFRATRGFEALGAAALPALPALSNLLNRPNPDVSVGWALVGLGSNAVPVLAAALASGASGVRSLAALSLGTLGTNAVEAVPALTQLLQAQDPTDRQDSLTALGRIRCAPRQVVPALIQHLDAEQDADVRFTTIVVLGLYADDARAAVPRLLDLYARSRDDTVRSTLRSALRKIDPSRAPPADPVSPQPPEPR